MHIMDLFFFGIYVDVHAMMDFGLWISDFGLKRFKPVTDS
jgi:hypothetical protein